MNMRAMLESKILVCDGAMGTMLHAAGNSLDQALPALNLSNPALVRTIHDSYISAGVDVIQTNTFGASRLRLAEHGFGDRVEDINRAGARIARQAVPPGSGVLVAGSVAPAVTVQQRRRVAPEQRIDALREQIETLAGAGIDLILLETFGYLDEFIEAIQVATATAGIPVIAQATFGTDALTLSGHTPREVAAAVAGLPVAALGTNCTLGPQRSLTVVQELREHTGLPLTVQPNAGLPRRVAPARFEYDIDSEYFARYVRQLLEAGARMVGGCCGTTPAQLAAAVQVASDYRQQHRPRPAHTAGQAPAAAPPAARPQPATMLVQPGRPLVVAELSPPPTGDIGHVLDVAQQLSEAGVDLISATAARTSRAQVSVLDLALHLHQQVGIETMASVTTWDRTIMALQADLLGAHALGLRRIICETGTPPLLGDYPHVDGIWDVDSIGLIELLASLNRGADHSGLQLAAKTDFEIGARINPGSRDPDRAAGRALSKIAAGAHFLLTHPVYELAGLEQLLDRIGGQVPVLAAVRPLTSFEEAEYLAHEVPDVTIPPDTLTALQRAGADAPRAGLDLAAALATRIKDLASGLVITPSADPVASTTMLMACWR